jgi:hypothetical protein
VRFDVDVGLVGTNASNFKPEDGGSMFLRNVSIYLQVHTALLPRRPTFSSGHSIAQRMNCVFMAEIGSEEFIVSVDTAATE